MHCLNLATAVATVLYDRHAKMNPDAHLNHTLQKRRGFEIMIQVPAPLQQWNDAVAYTSIDQGPADAYEEPPIENFAIFLFIVIIGIAACYAISATFRD